MKYKSGYKYQLAEFFELQTGIGNTGANSDYIALDPDGYMVINAAYAWDGPSGPTFDTKNSMTPSLVHDCFCQLIREGHLTSSYRKPADKLFYRMCRDRGMNPIRAWIWYRGVRFGARFNEQKPRPILEVK